MANLKVLVACCFVRNGCGLNILGVFPAHGYSQYLIGSSLMTELARRGHNVTVIAPHRQNQAIQNYSEIYVEGLENFEADLNLFDLEKDYTIWKVYSLYQLGLTFTEHTLANKAVQQFLASNQSFDLVICEQFATEALYGFAWHFNAPLVMFSTIGPSEWISDKAGYPLPFSYVPHGLSKFTSHMNFIQRFENVYVHIFDIIYRNMFAYPTQNKVAQKYFSGIPHLDLIMYNVSLFLTNSHVAITEPVPVTPNVIEVGGLQISHRKLPKDLQDFLDGASHGSIYLSMGSNLRSRDLTNEQKMVFVNTFSKLKQRVLWKYEEDKLPSKQPSNVMIRKWLPQQDVLAHPNVKAFISHGGLLGSTEAAFSGVPIIGIPIFGDQKMNVAKLVTKGTTIHVPYNSLSEESLTNALNKILNNSKYNDAAKRLSSILNDQQTKPMDRAIYWIEYVHRHRGAPFLKPASLELMWYQYFAVDVLLATCTLLSIPIVIYCIISKCKYRIKDKLE
ncbi:UDP-glucuronosyltransferase 2B31-like isoform X2 [Agrilus planipennis]|uniref:UDP-glucuronosyltransferase n=1 Tax=Agrilus planipennis TaxID=224129 RepID=A0A1W4XNG6_AGRPL|nr:UDP-glucuronosyltransferase 2B31-like isoform X2 [Agrilus planipennis]